MAAKLLDQSINIGRAPELDWHAEREGMDFLRLIIGCGQVSACRDVGDGGVITTAAKMVVKSRLCLQLDLASTALARYPEAAQYFGEIGGAYLICFSSDGESKALQSAATLRYNALVKVGQVVDSSKISWGPWSMPLKVCHHAFTSALS